MRAWPGPAAFLERAGPWLLRREAEHNLLLGLAAQPPPVSDPLEPHLFATIERGGEVVGCAFRTPPHKVGLTRMPLEAMDAVVALVGERYASVPAVFGPGEEVRAFASRWSTEHGCNARPGMRQRIHVLQALIAPARSTSGRVQPGSGAHAALVASWMAAFMQEAKIDGGDPALLAARLLREDALVLWCDPEPRSMAAISGRTPHGARVGWVYTPPEHRGRGYASHCVAALSRTLLEDGCRHLFLYTDLANPTSNRIYAALGYRPVADIEEVVFDGSEP